MNPVTNKVYVTNTSSNGNVAVIDAAHNNAVTMLWAKYEPRAVAINTVTNKIYVANSEDPWLTVIDGDTNAVTNIAMPGYTRHIAINPVTNKIYVAVRRTDASVGGSIVVVDGATQSVKSLVGSRGSDALAVNTVTNRIYASNPGDSNIFIINGDTDQVTTISVDNQPSALAVNENTNCVFVGQIGDSVTPSTVSVLDGGTGALITKVNVGAYPYEIAVHPVTNKIYVANRNDDTVTVIDGETYGTTSLTLDSQPIALALNPASNHIYVGLSGYNFVTSGSVPRQVAIIDGHTNQVTEVAAVAEDIAFNPTTNKIYLADKADGAVGIIDEGPLKTTSTIALNSSANPTSGSQNVTFTATVNGTSPTGTVNFRDGSERIGTAVLSGGAATFATSILAPGTHSISADYLGDANNTVSSSAKLDQVINGAIGITTTTLTADRNPQIVSSPVIFTATVTTTGSKAPTGLVTFQEGAEILASGTVSESGKAIFWTSSLAVGTHPITATYQGDGSNSSSNSAILTELIQSPQYAASISLEVTPNPAAVGAPTVFTATVYGMVGGPALSGKVTFKDGTETLATQDLTSGGVTTFSTSTLAAGVHSITAVYSGDPNYYDTTSQAVSLLVSSGQERVTTTIDLAGAVISDIVIDPDTNILYVANSYSTPGSNDGDVAVIDGADNTLSARVDTGSMSFSKQLAVNPATKRLYILNGTNVGVLDTNSNNIIANVPVDPYPQSIAMNPATNTVYALSAYDQTTGSVTIVDGQTNAGSTVSLHCAPLAIAVNKITSRVYIACPNSDNTQPGAILVINASTGETSSITVGKSPMALAVDETADKIYVSDLSSTYLTVIDGASNVASPLQGGIYAATAMKVDETAGKLYEVSNYFNTAVVIDLATDTATNVSVGSSPTAIAINPTKHKAYITNSSVSGSVSVFDATTGTTDLIPVGTSPKAIVYDPVNDSVYVGNRGSGTISVISSGAAHTTTATTLSITPNPATNENQITLTATVSNGTSTVPTGSVAFKDGDTLLGSAELDASGQGSYSVSSLAPGEHSITAIYEGDLTNARSTSSAASLEVTGNLSGTTSLLSVTPNPATTGMDVTFTATVTSVGQHVPSGTVTFTDGTSTLGTAELNASGMATLVLHSLTSGAHAIVASYGGDTLNAASESSPVEVMINEPKGTTNTALTSNYNPAMATDYLNFTATVTSSGSHIPTGTVIFKDGSTTLGSGTLNSSGVATYYTTTLSVGDHPTTASYPGDQYNEGSTSAVLTQTITPFLDSTNTSLTVTPNPATSGSTVTLSAKIQTKGSHTPTGSVTFTEPAGVIGSADLNATAVATLTTSSLTVGTHQISAKYSGDTYNRSGTSNIIAEVINQADNPVPVLTAISPASATAGGGAFVLTVTGLDFINGSIIQWNGSDRTTIFVSSTQLTATISAGDIATAGSATIAVFTPTPGGGTSSTQSFTITQPDNPAPALTSISPSSATAGDNGFILTVNGSNFINGSVIKWNGNSRATVYVSPGQLTADISASDIATVGTATVAVFNPTPGGGASANLTFTINPRVYPVPIITSITPGLIKAGSGAFKLTVTGRNFASGATVLWNGAARTTTFAEGALQADISAADVSTAGTADITVANPQGAGGTVSQAMKFVIDTASTGGFAVGSTTTTVDIQTGQSAQVPITLNGVTAAASVTVTCVNLPPGATCSYANRVVTISTSSTTPAGSYPIIVIFQTTETLASIKSASVLVGALVFGIPFSLIWVGRRNKQLFVGSLLLVAFVLALASLNGCGGNENATQPPQQPTTSQSSLALTLTVH